MSDYTVVVIDDDSDYAALIVDALIHEGRRDFGTTFRAAHVHSIVEFEGLIQTDRFAKIDLVLVDDNFSLLRDPASASGDMKHHGIEVILPRLQILRTIAPNLQGMRFVLMSAYVGDSGDSALVKAADRTGADDFWAKDGLGAPGVLVPKVLSVLRGAST